MSTTYSFICHKCKKVIPAGQTSGSGAVRWYRREKDYMTEHVGHPVELSNDLVDRDDIDDYEEVDSW